jgi:enamine deaminase RidA (YjgF/YER057c/UK114 family)
MTHTARNPDSVRPPGGRYSHSIEVEPGARWLYVAGQTGVAPDGSVPEGIVAQTEFAWSNLIAVLEDAGYALEDVVQMKTFLVRREDREGNNEVRNRYLDGHRPASTFLLVSGLADPRFLVEVEAVAAKHDG